MFPLHQIAHVGVSQSRGLKLFRREVILEEFQPMWSRYLIVTDGQTDRQTDESNLNTALCTSASRGKKTVEVRIMQLSPQSSPMILVSSWLTSPRNSKGNLGSGGAKWEMGSKNTQFSANKSPYLRNGARYEQGYYDRLTGSRICAFDLVLKSPTLDDLERPMRTLLQ